MTRYRSVLRFAVIPVFALCAAGTAHGSDPVLIAEVRDTGATSACCATEATVATRMAFTLMYGFRDFSGGTKSFGMDADVEMGGAVLWPPAQADFADFTTSSAGFADLAARLTNDLDEVIWKGALGVDGADHLSGGQTIGGFESAELDGIHTGTDLAGFPIDFIRLIVHNVQITSTVIDAFGHIQQDLQWDTTWQFWSGQPLSSGGGQRSDVDDFLAYVNPLQRRTHLPVGTTSFPVRIVYGATVDSLSFRVSLDGVPFAGFHPVPGTNETVTIPLSTGSHTLELQVDGIRSDGRVATDRDQLVFIVP